ncbi:MAG: hypothetical protein LBR07_02785 [Puniceicoccales bacterium]|jgi:alpha-N-arabinofuranosidase|nr:hypothetical protein [Puniceicoccales bacterium]
MNLHASLAFSLLALAAGVTGAAAQNAAPAASPAVAPSAPASPADAVKIVVGEVPAGAPAGTGTVSPLLFGHNIEHTRSCVYQGLSAQVLRNRKFAGKPTGYFGGPVQWKRYGTPRAFINITPTLAYTKHNCRVRGNRGAEINAVSLQNPIAGERGGIQQDNLPLKGGAKYVFKVIANTPSPVPVPLLARFVDRAGAVLAERTFAINGEKYAAYEFAFTPAADELNATLQLSIDARAELRIGAVSLLPADNFHGMRRDVVERLKDIGARQLRWPGGNFAGEYYWKDGLLPVDQRAPLYSYMPVETQTHSDGFDFHEIGIDEFIALCREVGAEPSLTLNLSWEPSHESAQWVEYCNGDATTEWGRKRIERGHKEPYNVKYWSLGNELGYGHMEGLNSPAEYAKKALQTAGAMRRVTPDLQLCCSGFIGNAGWRRAMAPLAKELAFASFHSYQGSFHSNGNLDFIRERALRRAYEDVARHADGVFNNLRGVRAAMSKDAAFKHVSLSFDEWNTVHALHHEPSIIEGVMAALMLGNAIAGADELGLGAFMFFEPINEGAIIVQPLLTSYLTATGQVFSLFKKHTGNKVLPVTIGGNAAGNAAGAKRHPDLRATASINPTTGERVLTLVNKNYDTAVSVSVSGFGTGATGSGTYTLLDGSNLTITPGARFREKRSEIPTGTGTTAAAGSPLPVSIPPRSVVQMTVK